jgi:hypothetical protein
LSAQLDQEEIMTAANPPPEGGRWMREGDLIAPTGTSTWGGNGDAF